MLYFNLLPTRCWSKNPEERPTFRELFNILSLSFEHKAKTMKSSLPEIISDGKETDHHEYLLDNVDTNQLFDYLHWITSESA